MLLYKQAADCIKFVQFRFKPSLCLSTLQRRVHRLSYPKQTGGGTEMNL